MPIVNSPIAMTITNQVQEHHLDERIKWIKEEQLHEIVQDISKKSKVLFKRWEENMKMIPSFF
ncbi:hypothetical protein KHA80_02070 [Anaerobacillus sp. HL2]|nr:hypothetical protein KHA80_02070 [Anaerobacillus sp. HL2]